MSVANKTRRSAAVLATITRLSMPVGITVVCASVPGCLFTSPGPSNVAQGKQYASGEAEYDRFFSELYLVQLAMGQAPNREQAIRERIASVTGAPATASTEELADALDKRAAALSKAGVTLRLSTTDLDEGKAPTATLVTSGTATEPNDVQCVAALSQSVKEAAALVADMRAAKPTIDRLNHEAPGLSPGVDTAFHKSSAGKKKEVRKNLHDAEQLIPLMEARANEVDQRVVTLLRKLSKVLGTSAAAPAPPPEPEEKPVPKKGKGKGAGHAEPKAAPKPAEGKPAEPKPDKAAEPKAEKPASKPKAPPSDDFEP
jgi:hypothetical protein